MLTVIFSTPQGERRLEEVQRLVAQSVEGELAVYPHHAPLVALLQPGVTRITRGVITERWSLSGGILEVKTAESEVIFIVERAEQIKAS